MKARLSTVIGIIALATVAAIAVGCSGGGGSGDSGMTAEEYFRQVEGLVTNISQESVDLGNQWEEDVAAAGSEQERVELTSSFYDALFSRIAPFRDRLADIEPPQEVEEAHKELVRLAGEYSSAWSDISAEVDGAESEAELGDLITSDAFVSAGQQFEEGCFKLQGIADDMEIDVDLRCGD